MLTFIIVVLGLSVIWLLREAQTIDHKLQYLEDQLLDAQNEIIELKKDV